LRTFRGDLGGRRAVEPHRRELRLLARRLGEVRAFDVFLEWTSQSRAIASPQLQAAFFAISDAVTRRREPERRKLRSHLHSQRYARFLRNIASWQNRVVERAAKTDERRIRDLASRRIQRAVKRVLAFDSKGGITADNDLHSLRVACKRLRYIAGFFQQADPRGFARLIKRATALQDALGTWNDCHEFALLLARLESERSVPAHTVRLATAACLGRQKDALKSFVRHWSEFISPAHRKWIGRLEKRLAARR
jgi:CHAD domain-containing protein